jgi:hypothetical protein
MTQHILGLLLMTYLFGFSIAYWQRLRSTIQAGASPEPGNGPPAPLTWLQGLGVVLTPIPRSLVWFMGKRSGSAAP